MDDDDVSDDTFNNTFNNTFKNKYKLFLLAIFIILIYFNKDAKKNFMTSIFVMVCFLCFFFMNRRKSVSQKDHTTNKDAKDVKDTEIDAWFFHLEESIKKEDIEQVVYYYQIIHNLAHSANLLDASPESIKVQQRLQSIVNKSQFISDNIPQVASSNTFQNPHYDISPGIEIEQKLQSPPW